MTHDELEKLKQNPEKYRAFRDKVNSYRRKNKDKINKYNREYRQSHPEYNKKHKEYIKKFQQENKELVNERNKKCRQKRGPEYIRNYMRKYRQENRNNIREKEKNYQKTRLYTNYKQQSLILLNEYKYNIDKIIKSNKELKTLFYKGASNKQLKQVIHKVVEPELVKFKNTTNNNNIGKTLANRICNAYIKDLSVRFN